MYISRTISYGYHANPHLKIILQVPILWALGTVVYVKKNFICKFKV